MKFVGAMAVLALLGSTVTMPNQMKLGISSKIMIDRALDLITVAVPPALPAAMSCGVAFAMQRLRRDGNIFCISPPRINMAG